MKIGILSRSSDIYSTGRLKEEALAKGHEVEIIDHLNCYMNLSAGKPEIHYQERILSGFDALIPRIGASVTFYGTAVVRQFENMDTYVLNSSVSIVRARDKLRAQQVLSYKGIPMPVTGFAHSTKSTQDLINMVGGAPLIIKLLSGTQGQGVVLAETKKAAESVINAFRCLDAYFLVQQFVKEADHKDIRCFVLDGKIIAAMERVANEGDFRANLHRGGIGNKVMLTPEEEEVAIRAAEIIGVRCSGVDLIRSNNGPLVLEVNSSPGLKGIESVTGVNVSREIISFLEKEIK